MGQREGQWDRGEGQWGTRGRELGCAEGGGGETGEHRVELSEVEQS